MLVPGIASPIFPGEEVWSVSCRHLPRHVQSTVNTFNKQPIKI